MYHINSDLDKTKAAMRIYEEHRAAQRVVSTISMVFVAGLMVCAALVAIALILTGPIR